MSDSPQSAPDLYLDHNATSPLGEAARRMLVEILGEAQPLNPGSVHRHGQRARARLERARHGILRHLGAPPNAELVFTSGATEANHRRLGGATGNVVSSRLEHPSIRAALEWLEELGSIRCRWVPHDAHGRHDLDALRSMLPGASLAMVCSANSELGTMTDLSGWASACASESVPLHVDASQTFGRFPSFWPEGVTSMTVSAHKAGGPVGVGGLALLRDTPLARMLPGGHQERGRRPGTEGVALAAAWAAMLDADAPGPWTELAPVRDAFEQRLAKAGAVINAQGDQRLPNTSNVSFPGRESEELLMQLDLAGVSASAGSACTAGSIDPSPVLIALGIDDERVRSAIRFSFGPEHRGACGATIAERVLRAING